MLGILTENTTIFIFGIIVGVLVGYGLGFLMGRHTANKIKDIRTLQINSIIFVVTLIWTMSTVLDIVSATYETPFMLNLFFGVVTGFLLDINVLKYIIKK